MTHSALLGLALATTTASTLVLDLPANTPSPVVREVAEWSPLARFGRAIETAGDRHLLITGEATDLTIAVVHRGSTTIPDSELERVQRAGATCFADDLETAAHACEWAETKPRPRAIRLEYEAGIDKIDHALTTVGLGSLTHAEVALDVTDGDAIQLVGSLRIELAATTLVSRLLSLPADSPLTAARHRTAKTALFVALRVPAGLDAATFALANPALSRLAGLAPARHLGWLRGEVYARLDDFEPPDELVPGFVLGGSTDDADAARAALVDLAKELEKLWGVRFRSGPDGVHAADLPWLVGCRPGFTIGDGFAHGAYDIASLADGSSAPPPAIDAPPANLLVVVDGARLRSLNDHLTAIELPEVEGRRPGPLEAVLKQLVIAAHGVEGGIEGSVGISLEP